VSKGYFTRIRSFAILAALTCAGLASSTVAQTTTPRFATLTPRYLENLAAPATPTVTHWTGNLSAGGSSFTMVGTDPATTNSATTVTAFLIPVRIVISPTPTGIFDPAHVLPNGRSVIQNTVLSPIFNSGIDFVQGGVDLGNTQYIDAFQRGNFWKYVQTHTGYHVLLGTPTVLPVQTITVSSSLGSVSSNPFGSGIVGTYDIFAFDSKLQSIIRKFPQITPGYHLNKRHWNTVVIDGSLPGSMIVDMIEDSYDLVVSKLPRSRQIALGWRPMGRGGR